MSLASPLLIGDASTLRGDARDTQAQLAADPSNAAAINTAVTEISQTLHVSSTVALEDLEAIRRIHGPI